MRIVSREPPATVPASTIEVGDCFGHGLVALCSPQSIYMALECDDPYSVRAVDLDTARISTWNYDFAVVPLEAEAVIVEETP